MDFKQLVNCQYGLGDEIKQFIDNCKKAPLERRTSQFYNSKIQRLQQYGQELLKNDTEINSHKQKQIEDDYFSTAYYERINTMVVEFIKYLEKKALQLEADSEAGTTKSSGIENEGSEGQNRNSDDGVKKILRNQKALMRALNRNVEEIFQQKNEENPQAYYTIKTNILEKYMSDFDRNNSAIWEATNEDEIEGYTLETYYDMEAKVEAAIIELQKHIVPESSTINLSPNRSNDQSTTGMHLPRLSLPKFKGDYLEWVAFKDLFTEMVHNSVISDSQKIQYLTQSLTDEPKNLIRHLPATGPNYAAAWEILTSRYDNKRLIVSTLLNKLISQPVVKNESPSSMKSLHDITKECLHGLSSQGLPIQHWDTIVAHIVVRKMDQTTQGAFEQSIDDNRRIIALEEVLKFLERRFQSLEIRTNAERTARKTCGSVTNTDGKCQICKKDGHRVNDCTNFKNAPIKEKWSHVKTYRLCVNCLKTGHHSRECKSRHCTKCTKRHHTLLHSEENKPQSNHPTTTLLSTSTPAESDEILNTFAEHPNAVSLVTNQANQDNTVLLGTAKILLVNKMGRPVECKAVLDSGSQVNLITGGLLRKLGITAKTSHLHLEGIGKRETAVRHRTVVTIQSKLNGFMANIDAHVIPKIVSDQPAYHINTRGWNLPDDVILADPEFNKPGRVDCLLGADIFFDLLTRGNLKIGENLPTLQNTVFGWIVAGSVGSANITKSFCGVCTTLELETMIAKFWNLEEIPDANANASEEDLQCELHFAQNTTRRSDGKFMVRLPLKDHKSAVGDTRELAYYRLKHIEKRLSEDSKLKTEYTAFLREYESLGHMTEVKLKEIPKPHYFIPHHFVLRPESTSTKLRVVFDASAHRAGNQSLNDIMHTGPTVQSELFSILLRFRTYKYVLKTDVEKMYRQIWVHPNDRNLQLIMWRENSIDQVKIYQLNTITYGTRAAPFLATRCLKQLAEENLQQFPDGAHALRNNFYVDDGLVGANTLKEAKNIQQELTGILNSAGMKLKKWCANHPQLLNEICPEDQEITLDFDSTEDQKTKTLGLIWLPKSDFLGIKANPQEKEFNTKRSVTSDVARIYDPLGLIAPVIVTAKIFIQQLWQLKYDWDTQLPPEMHSQWDRFRSDLPSLERTKIARYIFGNQDHLKVELHAFADASERAYGAAIYIRAVLTDKSIKVSLLCSKSRVAPLKTQTIPRLELCAALVASELMARVKADLNYQTKPTYYWSDSQIALSWISHHTGSLPPFVGHRASKIRQLSSPHQWRFVPSKQNPADILSRGLKPHELLSSHMWFYGPLFLYQHEQLWPAQNNRTQEFPIVATVSKAQRDQSHELDWVYRIPSRNSFLHVQRTVGYVLRFIAHTKHSKASRADLLSLTPTELNAALMITIRQIQNAEFSTTIKTLAKEKFLPKSHQLSSLTPFLDEEGVMRVGGRLSSSNQSFDATHQMIVPYNDPLVILLIEKIHKENYHCGPQALVTHVREKFWPLKIKVMARSVVQRCVRCTKAKPTFYQQIMGNLPDHRVQPARPFLNSGVDYCGPFLVHYKVRGKRPQRAYISVFCCFATKAVHLELVTELTTDAFIGALKRFIARRGHCKTLYCDNATNFVGAQNKLKEINEIIYTNSAKELIVEACGTKGIEFKFIPPRSPHFGGLWEAAVKSAKHLLMKNVSTASLTYEEMETVVVEIEAILNSRPLIPSSSDANDLNAITPGHFLIGEHLTSSVDVKAKDPQRNLLERWQLVSQLKHNFWQRWSREYLSELQQRHKWKGPISEILPNTMVIIKEDNVPVLQWPLGRIVKTYKGDDGLVRVCDVQTKNGTFKRAVHRLAPLFPENNTEKDENKRPAQINQTSLLVRIPLNRIKSAKLVNVDASPAKRHRPNSSLLLTIITLLLLPLALCDPINITKFNNKPGIFFEQLSTIKLLSANWKLIVYFDLESYQQQMNTLTNGMKTLQKACDYTPNNKSCSFLLEYFEHTTAEMKTDLNLLSTRRSKRGAIDIVGNFANSLFGILDSNYATQMSQKIDELKENDEHLERLLKNQTSVIDSTINIVKRNQQNIQAKFNEIDNQIHSLLFAKNSIDNIETSQNILMLSVQMFMLVHNLQRIHSAIMDVLIDSHHDKLNPTLLTPQQMTEEIVKIKANLPAHLHLPIFQNNVLDIYKLIKLSGVVAKNHVIFSIDLPLTDPRELQLLHLVPIVAAKNNTLLAIKLSTNFLAISPHHDEFFPMKQHQVDACQFLNENQLLCSNIQATYQSSMQPIINKCEIDLVNDRAEPRCELQQLKDTTLWYQLHHPNQWIYATLNSIKLQAVCGDDTTQLTLESSGLMILRADCVIKNDLITIQGRQQIVTTLQTSISKFRPLMSMTRQYNSTKINTTTFQLSTIEFDSIQQQIESIKHSTFPKQQITYHHHGLSIGYAVLALGIYVLTRFLWQRFYRSRQDAITLNQLPTPMPRNQSMSVTAC